MTPCFPLNKRRYIEVFFKCTSRQDFSPRGGRGGREIERLSHREKPNNFVQDVCSHNDPKQQNVLVKLRKETWFLFCEYTL